MTDGQIITNAMLRAQDQERIALLEALLREAEADIYWANVVLKERIRAALGEG